MTLEDLLELVFDARLGDDELAAQLVEDLQSSAADETIADEDRILYSIMVEIVTDNDAPDLSTLPDILAERVAQLLADLAEE